MIALRVFRILSVFISVVGLLNMSSGYVYAGVITINFPTDLADPRHLTFHNTTAKGFRISPGCHYDISVAVDTTTLPGIGWDRSGCPPNNPESLGGELYVDDNGSPFTLLSVNSLGESLMVQSSKGGVATVPINFPITPGVHFDFIGPAWQDIQWVKFFYGQGGAPSGGFNQLVVLVPVPAPSTFGLLGLGVLILGWRSWALRRHAEQGITS